MEENQRKVVYQEGSYQLLKPRPSNSSWFGYGKRKSLKAIVDASKGDRFVLEMSSEIGKDIRDYIEEQKERTKEHFRKKGLNN